MKKFFAILNLFFFIVLSSVSISCFAQEKAKKDTTKYHEFFSTFNINYDLLNEIILSEINDYRESKDLDELVGNEVLKAASKIQADYLAKMERNELLAYGKLKTTQKRIVLAGGSGFGKEMVMKTSVKKGKDQCTYKQIAEEIVNKWIEGTKTTGILNDPGFVFCGISSNMDEGLKKVYVSCVVGNYKSFNDGAKLRSQLEVPFTTKKYGIKTADDKICKKAYKFKNIEELQKGLYIKDNKVFLKYNNLKAFKKLIKGSKDGLAVDFVLKDQYSCSSDVNIVDNRLNNKGIMLKRVYSSKIYKKNLIKGKKVKQLDVQLGDVPKGLQDGQYEMNLIIIQNKCACRNIQQTFLENGGVEYKGELALLADTATTPETTYKPSATSTFLTFKVPFDKSKFTYKTEDVNPFIQSLNEPEFIINELTISAFSSIEGSDKTNEMLQGKRAESIVAVLKQRQKSNIKTNIVTSDNWEQFKLDIQSTEWSNIGQLAGPKEAQEYIRNNKLTKKLEPILSKHRYAQIDMNVTYDISGNKEQAYVVAMFNKSVEQGNAEKALAIQKYIFKKVISKKYTNDAVTGQILPEKELFDGTLTGKIWLAGLVMNKLWLTRYINEEDLEGDYCEKINKLHKIDPSNPYISFNTLYCDVLFNDLGDDKKMLETEAAINNLYPTSLGKKTVDALNLEYQFKVINVLDTLEETHPKITESLDKIKNIVNLKESNWQNSLKLAYLFIDQKDFDFAAKLLEPFVYNDKVFEELLFTYISLCSYSSARLNSNRFATAMKKAQKLNPKRYCSLFDGNKFPLQVFENTQIKETYCKSCKKTL